MLEDWNKGVGCVGQSVQEVRVRPPPFLGHQYSGNFVLPQILGFAIFVASKL